MTDLDQHDYMRLLTEVRPRPVCDASDYLEQRGWLERLMSLPPTQPVSMMIELLSITLAAYESEHSAMPASAPHELLRHLVDSSGMAADDVAVALGISVASLTDYATGQQPMPPHIAGSLAGVFGVEPELFTVARESSGPRASVG